MNFIPARTRGRGWCHRGATSAAGHGAYRITCARPRTVPLTLEIVKVGGYIRVRGYNAWCSGSSDEEKWSYDHSVDRKSADSAPAPLQPRVRRVRHRPYETEWLLASQSSFQYLPLESYMSSCIGSLVSKFTYITRWE